MTICQKVPKLYFKVNFWCQKSTLISSFNFGTTLFYKIMPNVWRTDIHRRNFLKKFPLGMLILGQKSCSLKPTIFEIPQLNWY